MKLRDFIKQWDWEEIIKSDPYNVLVKWNGDYCLLKYNQFASDMSNDIVQQCRGTILYKNEFGEMELVCMPFYKFFNWGETNAHEIDWTSAVVMEKVDGSLINLWYHNGGWNVSTSGNVDAFRTFMDSTGANFGELFVDCIKDINDFICSLDTDYTYMFELTTSKNRVVVHYNEDAVWFLGRRNIHTLEEDVIPPSHGGFKIPKTYKLSSLEDCIAAAAALENNAEGFVVRDKNWNRIKVKNPAWIAASKLHVNGNITAKNVISMYLNGTLDDYIGTFPDEKDKIDFYLNPLFEYVGILNGLWDPSMTAREIAASDSPYKTYLFGRMRGKWFNGEEYIRKVNLNTLLRELKIC